MRRAAHVDDNQPAIVLALQQAGYSTQSLAPVGLGCPDLIVGFAGVNILIEVKNRDALNGTVKRGRGLNDEQLGWHARWRGQVSVVHTPEEALEVCSRILAREKLSA